MQEEVESKTLALTVSTAKLTGRVFKGGGVQIYCVSQRKEKAKIQRQYVEKTAGNSSWKTVRERADRAESGRVYD